MTFKKTLFIILTLLWVAVIFSFSLQSGDTSSQISSGFGKWLIQTFLPRLSGELETMPAEQLEYLHYLLRKCGHFSEFFILGILVMKATFYTDIRYKVFSGILFCVLVASVDETLQLFVDGRAGRISDVILDSVGAAVGIGMFYLGHSCFCKYFTNNFH